METKAQRWERLWPRAVGEEQVGNSSGRGGAAWTAPGRMRSHKEGSVRKVSSLTGLT